jgi:biotin carboxylase
LSENIRKEISDITIKTINAIGITNGPSHTEIIVTSEGPKVVEIGARMGGDYITSHLVPLSTGIDMLEAVINLTIGNYPNIIPKFSNGSSIKYFNFRQGKVHNIYDKITETDLKNLVEYNIDVSIGDTIKPIENSSGRYGHVICRGETVFEAQEYASKYIKK